MTPIIEEYTVLLNISSKTPDKVYLQKPGFKKSLAKILGIHANKLDPHIKEKGQYHCISWDFLHNFIQEHQSDDKGLNAMALAIYGMIIFPKALGYINSEVVTLVEQIEHGVNPVPVILAETFRSLNYCRTNGGGRFTGCAQLLYIWMKSHTECHNNKFTDPRRTIRYPITEFCSSEWPRKMSKHMWMKVLPDLSNLGLQWKAPWMTHDPVLYRCGDYPWVPLLGLWGGISYAPAMVRRQIGSEQFIPMTHMLNQLEFSYKDEGAAQLKEKITQAWKQAHRVRPGNFTCNTTKGYSEWHEKRGKGFLAPRVFGPNLPLQLGDEPEDYQAEIEARYELASQELQTQNRSLVAENKRLKSEMDGYKNQVEQSNKRAKQFQKLINGITPRNKELEEENSSLSTTVEMLTDAVKRLEDEVADLQAGLEFKTVEHDKEERRNRILQNSVNDLNQQIRSQQVKIQKLKMQCERLDEKCQMGISMWKERYDHIHCQVGTLISEIGGMARQAKQVAMRTDQLRQVVLPGQPNADQLLTFLDSIYEQFVYFGNFF